MPQALSSPSSVRPSQLSSLPLQVSVPGPTCPVQAVHLPSLHVCWPGEHSPALTPQARTALREISSGAKDAEIRDAALQGMLIGNDEEGVLALYRASKNADEKRALLRTLSMMDSDAALQAIDAALESKP